MDINSSVPGAYIFSSGKNMGAFKGVGYPEEIGDYFKLDEYKGYIWTAHGRFPTNTPGWWGGAHPFTLLDWSVVHNGEISSYGANRRYLEMFDYQCSLQTDTEAITYIFDFLLRKQKLPLEIAVKTVCAPLWSEIEREKPHRKELLTAIRTAYSSLLINGPFSIILGTSDFIIALNDRVKLRSLTAAEKGDNLYVASEESAIRAICPKPDYVWTPKGGEPVIGRLEKTNNCHLLASL
jgi:glutamate synthase domain-containing protein 1